MTYGKSLLRAILDDPGSDVARLAYADHLEETGGGERAEFIRVQVELAKWPYPIPSQIAEQLVPYRKRERELLAGRDYEWFFPRGVLADWAQWRFRRGFVNSIELTTADFLAHAADLFAAQPITEVRLTDRQPAEESTGWVRWYGNNDRFHHLDRCLPMAVFDRLTGEYRRYDYQYALDPNKYYLSDGIAHAALSRACVAYGREQAGLPPLPEDS